MTPPQSFIVRNQSILVAGHSGLLGRSVVRSLEGNGANVLGVSSKECDLRDASKTLECFRDLAPDAVIVCAAKVAGVAGNQATQADMCHENLAIANSVIDGAHRAGINRLLYVASSAVYPVNAPQPLTEDAYLEGAPESSHFGYAHAKRAAIALCLSYADQFGREYFVALPTNLYGTHSSQRQTGHVIPMLFRKFRNAVTEDHPSVTLWGTGRATRDFLHSDDAAEALVLLLEKALPKSVTNIGSGQEVTIASLAKQIKKISGFRGDIVFDPTKPEGAVRRVLNISQIKNLGWHTGRQLETGLRQAFLELFPESISNEI